MKTAAKIAVCLCFVAVLTSIGCTRVAPNHPSGWIKFDEVEFSFYAPPDLKTQPAPMGEDSFAGAFKSDSIFLAFGYGKWSDPLEGYSERPEYQIQEERIDGMKAKIVSFHDRVGGPPLFDYFIAVHFPDLDGAKLTMSAGCKSAKDYETVRTIFRTLKFK